mmetsp:Transcript_37256/g.68729  ORF Transcript_37256/g.68729 Transcript_37256/m.68729 type:complete len:99 (+) Transcript_37256:939-1235(+)
MQKKASFKKEVAIMHGGSRQKAAAQSTAYLAGHGCGIRVAIYTRYIRDPWMDLDDCMRGAPHPAMRGPSLRLFASGMHHPRSLLDLLLLCANFDEESI